MEILVLCVGVFLLMETKVRGSHICSYVRDVECLYFWKRIASACVCKVIIQLVGIPCATDLMDSVSEFSADVLHRGIEFCIRIDRLRTWDVVIFAKLPSFFSVFMFAGGDC